MGQKGIPLLGDLAGWKEADRQLARRFADHFALGRRLKSARPVKRYFGDDDLDHFLSSQLAQGVVQAYTAWGVLDYRPSRTSQTHAEKMLAGGQLQELSESEATLLRARMDAYPTLYRIASHDPSAGTVSLSDVLLGGLVTVHDRLLSENIEDGLFITARVFPAGRFHFMELAGPPLGAAMGMDAAEFLQRSGMEFTREGLRLDAHMFGWLWDWSDQWQANWTQPRMCNTDGDELLWHTASFTMADQQAVRAVLEFRTDVDYDGGAGEYVWSRDATNKPKIPGETVTLGRIELLGDELVLTVNSANRLAAARKWLERLPGLAFQGVTTRRWNEPEENRPLDERIAGPEPVEMMPDLAMAIQESITTKYMAWLDTPLPMLNGRTPRETCRTSVGRQQVAMLIRTIPDPMGALPIRVPRQAMLQQLGLEAEASREAIPSAPMPRLHGPELTHVPDAGAGKVGRNEPCLCGSGKKYKKCCGR